MKVAYRAWRVGAGGELSAVAVSATWSGAKLTAHCAAGNRRRFHLPPNPDCRCGIYAWKRPIDPGGTTQWTSAAPEHVTVGVVRLWGRMCDGEKMTGYRAQHAQVVALVPDPAGQLDRDRYPQVRYYPDLLTMYGDWDVSPELGFAEDAATAAERGELVYRRSGTDVCLACGESTANAPRIAYSGRNPWVGGAPADVVLHRDGRCFDDPRRRFDREWAYANRQPARSPAFVR